jgi:hypothetical protein
VEELDQRHPKPKVIVADSLYSNHFFLAVFLRVKHALGLVRLRSNLVFYGPPKPHQKEHRGRPATSTEPGSNFLLCPDRQTNKTPFNCDNNR